MQTPKAQCEELLNIVVRQAEQFLNKYGEFYPFGCALKPDGSAESTMVHDGTEKPLSQPLIDSLRQGFRTEALAKRIVASALAYDVRVIPPGSSTKTDAIAVELDHQDQYSTVALFPYRILNGEATIQHPFAEKGEGRIFP